MAEFPHEMWSRSRPDALAMFAQSQFHTQQVLQNALTAIDVARIVASRQSFAIDVQLVFGATGIQESIRRAAATNKPPVAPQSEIAKILGVTSTLATLAQAIGATTRPILAHFTTVLPDFAGLLRGAVPRNLVEAGIDFDIDTLDQFMLKEGLPLAWTPRAAIVERVFAGSSPAARRAVYGRHWKLVVDDCDELLARCHSSDLAMYVRFAQKAVAGMRDGHHELAQAMIMNTFDTVLRHEFPPKLRARLTNTTKPLDSDEMTMHVYFAWSSIWSLHHRYLPDRGDPIPRRLNRHASVHGVSRQQYSRLNAVLALAHLTGLLWFLDTLCTNSRRRSGAR